MKRFDDLFIVLYIFPALFTAGYFIGWSMIDWLT